MVMLPVQAQTWVSDLVLSFPDQCWEIFLLTDPIAHILLFCLPSAVTYMQMAHPWLSEKQPKKQSCLWPGLVKVPQCGSLMSAVHGNTASSPSETLGLLLKLSVCGQGFFHSVSLQEVPLQGVLLHV